MQGLLYRASMSASGGPLSSPDVPRTAGALRDNRNLHRDLMQSFSVARTAARKDRL